MLAAMPPPVDAQAEQRHGEGEEHVDRVEHRQQVDVAVAPQQDAHRGEPHQHDAVLGHQAVREQAELVGHPLVGRHVGQHRGPAQQAGIGRDVQQRALQHQHHGQRDLAHCRRHVQRIEHRAEHHGVERFAGLRGDGMPQQVQHDDAGGGEGQRERHVEHGPLAGAHARLGQRIDVVRHRFDAGIGAAAQRGGAQDQRGHEDPAHLPGQRAGFVQGVLHHQVDIAHAGAHAVNDDQHVRDHEADENRGEHLDRLLHPAQIEKYQ